MAARARPGIAARVTANSSSSCPARCSGAITCCPTYGLGSMHSRTESHRTDAMHSGMRSASGMSVRTIDMYSNARACSTAFRDLA